jgi:peptidoglycan LD-endopeptidase LytH
MRFMRTGREPLVRPRGRLAATFVVVLLLVSMPGGAGAQDTEDKLAAARARLAEIERDIDQQSARLADLRAEVDAAAARVYEARVALEDTLSRIARTHDALADAEAEYQEIRARLDARARDVFINGPASPLELLLGAQSMADLTERVMFVGALAEQDSELANDVEDLADRLAYRQQELDRQRVQEVEQKERLQTEEAALKANLDEQQEIMAELTATEQELDQLVADLEDQLRREELARIRAARRAAALAAQQSPSGGPVAGSGGGPLLVCPVEPPYGYSSSFGAPRPGGRTHQGNDIFAPMGNAIYAPFSGTAVDASNWPLGGYAVKVYGSQGYVYNAHLSAIGELGAVLVGDIIGYVGNTGNATGISPHDHFEWHPGNGPAVDPYPYLQAVC